MGSAWPRRRAMRRLAQGLCAALVLACGLPALADRPVITISTNNTPRDRKALQAVSQEAFHRIGIEFRQLSLPSERSLQAANGGEVDGEGLRVAGLGEQYPNLLPVPERYLSVDFVAFARDASISLDQGWASLRPYRVAFINGWKMFEAHAGGARVVNKVDKPEQMFQMLEHGHVDLALYTQADGLALLRQLGLPSIAPLSPVLKNVDMYLYLNRRHEALVPRLAQAIRDMKVDGSYNRLMSAIGAD